MCWESNVEVIVCRAMRSCMQGPLEPFGNLAGFFIVVVLGDFLGDYTFWV